MKRIIIALVVISCIGCNKSKIRTCTIKSYDGITYTIITDKPMTQSEMNSYEKELINTYAPANMPGTSTKVSCK